MTWGGWLDDLSGLEKYQYMAYEMGHDGRWLKEQLKPVEKPTDIFLNNTQVQTKHSEYRLKVFKP